MPRGDKDKYTDKQKRQAEHIEQGYIKDGVSRDEAEERAWRTVNKQDGGGKKAVRAGNKPSRISPNFADLEFLSNDIKTQSHFRS